MVNKTGTIDAWVFAAIIIILSAILIIGWFFGVFEGGTALVDKLRVPFK